MAHLEIGKELRRAKDNAGKEVAYFSVEKYENGIVRMYQVLTDEYGNETLLLIEKPNFDFSQPKKNEQEIEIVATEVPVVIFASSDQ